MYVCVFMCLKALAYRRLLDSSFIFYDIYFYLNIVISKKWQFIHFCKRIMYICILSIHVIVIVSVGGWDGFLKDDSLPSDPKATQYS